MYATTIYWWEISKLCEFFEYSPPYLDLEKYQSSTFLFLSATYNTYYSLSFLTRSAIPSYCPPLHSLDSLHAHSYTWTFYGSPQLTSLQAISGLFLLARSLAFFPLEASASARILHESWLLRLFCLRRYWWRRGVHEPWRDGARICIPYLSGNGGVSVF